MGQAAAGIGLVADATVHVPGPAQLLKALEVRGETGRERRIEARRLLDHVLAAAEAFLGQAGGGDAVAGRESGVQRLGHRPEVADASARHRRGNAECPRDGIWFEMQETGGGRRAAKRANRRGGVPEGAALAPALWHRPGELGGNLEAGHVGFEQLLAARMKGLGQGEDSRGEPGHRLAHHDKAGVEVHGVRGGAVGERGQRRRRADAVSEERGLILLALVPRVLGGNSPRGFVAPGQRHADAVEDAALRPIDCAGRNSSVVEPGHKLSHLLCCGHFFPPARPVFFWGLRPPPPGPGASPPIPRGPAAPPLEHPPSYFLGIRPQALGALRPQPLAGRLD